MKDMTEELKQKRIELHNARNKVTKLQLEIELSEPGQILAQAKAYLEVIENETKKIDTRLREAAIDCYKKTGNKKPVDGVKVIINKSLEYSELTAIGWAVLSAPAMIETKLDKKKFEKHAKAIAETIPLEFVEIKEEPAARIAKELK